MLRLRTFGGLTLRLDGTPVSGVVTQRRQLGLLALLAVAGEEGMSRDKLLAYLWPEREHDSARHVLNQLLYAQRHHAGDAGLFLGRKTLRLNPQLIESDVQSFVAALAAGAPERAVAEYRGPFLDGFFLAGAVEFEAWTEEQGNAWLGTAPLRSTHSQRLPLAAATSTRLANGGAAPRNCSRWTHPR